MAMSESDLAAKQARYLVPYVDMMTTLAIFFLAIYAFYVGLKSEEQGSQEKNIAKSLKASINANETLKNSAKVEIIGETVKVTLPTSVIFDPGSANLQETTLPPLQELAKSFQKLPRDYEIAVEGNTDNAPVWYGGDFTSNWELSLYRSLSLIDVMTKAGAPPGQFVARGYAEYSPLYANDTPDHRAANRRVEIIIRQKDADMKNLNA